jgi:hypothetical protein
MRTWMKCECNLTRARLAALIEKTALHLKHLAELIDAPYKYDSHQCRTEHEKLEIEIDDFVKNFRKNKKNICHY